jgi:hypothetical protein
MNARRFTCFFLGAWMAVGVAVALIIFLNNRSASIMMDRLSPVMAAQVRTTGPAQSRLLFAFEATELNQTYREYWGTIQIVAGLLFLLFLVFATREGKGALAIGAAVLALVILQRTLLVPEISALTRLAQAGAGDRQKHFTIQMMYHGAEALKLLAGAVVAITLIREGRHRLRHAGQDVDVIDKADHRHINR